MAGSSIGHIRGAGQLRPLPQAHLAGMGADGERRKRTQLGSAFFKAFDDFLFANSELERFVSVSG